MANCLVELYSVNSSMPSDQSVKGAILADQLRSLDWRARKAERICELPTETADEVLRKAAVLVSIES